MWLLQCMNFIIRDRPLHSTCNTHLQCWQHVAVYRVLYMLLWDRNKTKWAPWLLNVLCCVSKSQISYCCQITEQDVHSDFEKRSALHSGAALYCGSKNVWTQFMFVCIWCYLCNSNNNVFKAHCLFTSFQPYTPSLVANMHLLSSQQYKGDLSTGQVFFFNTVITSCTLAQCASSSFLALTLSTEGSLKLFASPQMCISFGSTGV